MQVGLSRGTRSKTVPVVVLLAGILTITCRRNYAMAPNWLLTTCSNGNYYIVLFCPRLELIVGEVLLSRLALLLGLRYARLCPLICVPFDSAFLMLVGRLLP